MDKCPHCAFQLTKREIKENRCPSCGACLSDRPGWRQPRQRKGKTTDAQASSRPGTLSPEGSLSPADSSESESRAKLDADRLMEVTEAWQSTFARSAHAQFDATINSNSTSAQEKEQLNIDLRTLGRPGQDVDYEVAYHDETSFRGEGKDADYELEQELIGRGNMGSVWSARQASLDRRVAIKRPKPGLMETPEEELLFISEVVVTGRLDHPNIVPIYDMGRDTEGNLFYSMKHVKGSPWNAVIRTKSETENVEILMKVCDAVRFAHSKGFIHRDIKPHNVIVGEYGEVSLMDWGIAMSIGARSGGAWLAQGTGPAGTPAYMAPEMAETTTENVGVASDVYLLGAVLFEIIHGRPPHPVTRDTRKMLENILQNNIVQTDRTGELLDVAQRAMATRPSERYASVKELQQALREFQSHAESTKLTIHARKHLQTAENSKSYDDYQQAVFGFQNALDLWTANQDAAQGLSEAKVAYAKCAGANGDFQLALGMLDRDNRSHARMIADLERRKQESEAYQKRLRRARNIIRIGVAVFLIAMAIALGIILFYYTQLKNTNASLESTQIRLKATNADLTEKRNELGKKNDELIDKQGQLNDSLERLKQSNRNNARLAVDNRQKAELARRSEREAQEASYVNAIGLAAESVQRASFDRARELLASLASLPDGEPTWKPQLRHWEWGHLQFLTGLQVRSFEGPDGRLPPVSAVGMDGDWIVAGTRTGELIAWNRDPEGDRWTMNWKPDAEVYAVAISVAGEEIRIAASGQRQQAEAVSLWTLSPATNQRRRVDRKELGNSSRDRATSLAFAPDGNLLAVGRANGTATVYRLAHRDDPTAKGQAGPVTIQLEPFHVVRGHRADPEHTEIWSISFSPDGERFATAGEDGTVRIWSTRSSENEEQLRFDGHSGPVYAVAFSPTGDHVISGGADRRLLQWDAQRTSAEPRTEIVRRRVVGEGDPETDVRFTQLGSHAAAIRAISIAKNQPEIVASAGDDNVIKVWDAREDGSAPPKVLRGHGTWVRSVVAADDGKYILSGGYDGRVLLWDWQRYEVPRVLAPHRDLSTDAVNAAAYSPDGEWVVTVGSAGSAGSATIWDMQDPEDPKPMPLVEGHDWLTTRGILFDKGRRLVTSAGDNTTRIWDVRSGAQLVKLGSGWYERDGEGGTGWRAVVAVSHNGQWLVTGSDHDEPCLRLFRLRDPRAGDSSDNHFPGVRLPLAIRPSADGDVTVIAFSPDDSRLFVGTEHGSCLLVDPASGRIATKFVGHAGAVTGARFSADGRQVFTSSEDGMVIRWSVNTGEQLVLPHPGAVIGFDLSPDGTRAVTATSADHSTAALLRLWDVSGSEAAVSYSLTSARLTAAHRPLRRSGRRPVADATVDIRTVAFDADGESVLVTVSTDAPEEREKHQVGQWHPADRAYERIWAERALGDVVSASPGPTPAILTVGGKGARFRLLATGEETVSFRPQRELKCVCFSSDSQRLATGSVDGSVKFWRRNPESRGWQRDLDLPMMVDVHRGGVTGVAFQPGSSDRLLTTGGEGQVRLWQVSAGSWAEIPVRIDPRLGLGHHAKAVTSVAFSPRHEHTILTTSEDGTARIWNIATGAIVVLRHWEPAKGDNGELRHDSPVQCGAFSGDGTWVITGSGQSLTFWHVDSGERKRPKATDSRVTSVAFSRDGLRALSAGADFTARLWDTSGLVVEEDSGLVEEEDEWSPQPLLPLESHSGAVTSVAFAPNGRDVLTAGRDGQTIIWSSVAIPPSIRLTAEEVEYELGAAPVLLADQAQLMDPTNSDASAAKLTVQLESTGSVGGQFPELERLQGATVGGWQLQEAEATRLVFAFQPLSSDGRLAYAQLTDVLRGIGYAHDMPAQELFELQGPPRTRVVSFSLSDVHLPPCRPSDLADRVETRAEVTVNIKDPPEPSGDDLEGTRGDHPAPAVSLSWKPS